MLQKVSLAVCAILFCTCFGFAQEAPKIETGTEKSYEILLQVLIASNSADEKTELPNTLKSVVAKLKNSFPQNNYRLVMTSMGRIAERGNFDSKSATGAFVKKAEISAQPIFYDFSLMGARSAEIDGQKNLLLQAFRFGARIPIAVSPAAVNYENVGISLNRLTLREGIPTVIGTMNEVLSDGIIIVVLTVKDESGAK